MVVQPSTKKRKTTSHLKLLNMKRITTYGIENPGPSSSLGYAQNVAGLNRLMESEPALLDNWITHGYADSNK